MSNIEPISKKLNETNKPSFMQRYEQLKKATLQHPDVQAFCEQHKEQLTDDMIESSMSKIYEFTNQTTNCCGGTVATCTNLLKGHVPRLSLKNGSVDTIYSKCAQAVLEEQQAELASMVTTMYIPKNVLHADISSIDMSDTARADVVEWVMDFKDSFREKGVLPKKGLYLHGNFGVGKTHILATIANEFAKLKVPSLIVYTPELFRELKSKLQNNSFEESMKKVKNVPILMLDDLGSETISAWIRDEVLGSILQYRMSNEMPVFISSNYDYAQIEEQLSITDYGHEDALKAGRILERIKAVTVPFEITGINRRNS